MSLCDVSVHPYNRDCEGNVIPTPATPKQQLPAEAQPTGIPPEKLRAMQDYAKKLRRNSPTMKMERIQRKVAEKFKVKIV